MATGGAGIKVRVVKGANLSMERVEAELHGWSPAPYGTKAEVDANYLRLIERALRPELAGALRLGVASHNLYDVALAHLLANGMLADVLLFGGFLVFTGLKLVRDTLTVQEEGPMAILRWVRNLIPATDNLHGGRFLAREGGALHATPLLLALVADLVFTLIRRLTTSKGLRS